MFDVFDVNWKVGMREVALDVISCPVCGGGQLHQGKVEVWDRKQDDVEGIHVVIPHPSGQVVLDGEVDAGNPSPRRQGLAIDFMCERCHYKPFANPSRKVRDPFTLYIFQHKGTTYMSWEKMT